MSNRIPVYAVGPQDCVTLNFPTIPHDAQAKFCVSWDNFCGHGAASPAWIERSKKADPIEAAELLAEYCRLYSCNAEDYYLVDKLDQSYAIMRKASAEQQCDAR